MDTPDDVDRVLASLEYDGVFWRGAVSAKCWPEPIELELPAEARGPTEYQVEVLREVLAYAQNLKQVIERPLCDYYNSFEGETFSALDDNCEIVDWLIEPIDEPARIWDLLRGPTLHIEDVRGEHRIEFSLDFGPEWDPEHGLSARFVDFAFVEIA